MGWRPSRMAYAAWAALVIAALMQYARLAPIGNVLAVAIYFIVWWVCLFAVLPIGVRTQSDAGEVILGTSAGAPITPRLGFAAALNTIVTTGVFAIVLVALRFNIVPLQP